MHPLKLTLLVSTVEIFVARRSAPARLDLTVLSFGNGNWDQSSTGTGLLKNNKCYPMYPSQSSLGDFTRMSNGMDVTLVRS